MRINHFLIRIVIYITIPFLVFLKKDGENRSVLLELTEIITDKF